MAVKKKTTPTQGMSKKIMKRKKNHDIILKMVLNYTIAMVNFI